MSKTKKRIIWGLFGTLCIGGGVYWFMQPKKIQLDYTTVKIERGVLRQTVAETGLVKATNLIDLNFLTTGKLTKINAKIGETVKEGTLLAELDYNDLLIRKNEVEASLKMAQINYNKLVAGATKTEIAVLEAAVVQAETNYQNALNELQQTQRTEADNITQAEKTLNDLVHKTDQDITTYEQAVIIAKTGLDSVQTTYNQAIENKRNNVLKTIDANLTIANYALDKIKTLLEDDDAKRVLGVKNISNLNTAQTQYLKAKDLLLEWQKQIEFYKTEELSLEKLLDFSAQALNATFLTLNSYYSVLEDTVSGYTFTQSSLDNWKTTVNSQTTLLTTAINSNQIAEQAYQDALLAYETNLNTATENFRQAEVALENAIITARNNLKTLRNLAEQRILMAESKRDSSKETLSVVRKQLEQGKAPARSQDLQLQKTQIAQAQAMLNAVENNIQKNKIFAPMDGVITSLPYEIGEMTNMTKAVIKMINRDKYEIEVDISESDINKVALDNQTKVTLDAFGEDTKFEGKVIEIEPAETIIQDVIYYKVKIDFDASEELLLKIKPGMTANVIIQTAEKEEVLIIPSRAVIEKNGDGKFARILENQQIKEVPVQIGLRGDDGLLELISGLKEGAEVVTYVKD